MNRSLALRSAAAAALLLSLASASGCGRNHAGTIMAPTGIRPATGINTASVTGAVLFDPSHTPDLAIGPFPPTRVELFNGATLVAVDSLPAFSQYFTFEHVAPGEYSVVIRSAMFRANSRGGIQVAQDPVDAGNVTLLIDPLLGSSSIDVVGTMPNYTYDDWQSGSGGTTFLQNTLGVWSFPNDFAVINPIPAGTYHLKFVNSYASTPTNLIGYGGNPSETINAPVTDHVTVLGSGPATDLVVHFPTTAIYAFTFDERRQTFSIQATAPASPLARR